MSSTISVVVGFRNRDLERVKRYLDSLKNQIYSNFELIFVDYGSDLEKAKNIRLLTSHYPFCKYIYNDTRGWPWNRSHALNTGIRLTNGDYVLFSDIDLIYSKDFLYKVSIEVHPNKQLFQQFYLLPESFDYTTGRIELSSDLTNTLKGTKGAIHCVPREALMKLQGFDEFYCYWGLEDNDIFNRLKKIGIDELWMKIDDSPVFHQWHEIVSNQKPFFFPDRWYEQMQIYYHVNSNIITRNIRDTWGLKYRSNDREIFNRDVEICLDIPENIVLNTKSEIIAILIQKIKDLDSGEFISIKLPLTPRPSKYRDDLFNKVASIIKKVFARNTILVNNAYVTYCERLSIEKKAFLVPESDIYFIVWQLIKFEKIIIDYSIEYNENEIFMKIC